MGGEDPVDGLKELAPFVTTVVMKDCALTDPAHRHDDAR